MQGQRSGDVAAVTAGFKVQEDDIEESMEKNIAYVSSTSPSREEAEYSVPSHQSPQLTQSTASNPLYGGAS